MPDAIPRVARLIDERTRHWCNRSPQLGVLCADIPRPTAAHRVAHQKNRRLIDWIFIQNYLKDVHDILFAEFKCPFLFSRHNGSLLCSSFGLPENGWKSEWSSVRAEWVIAQRRYQNVAVLLG